MSADRVYERLARQPRVRLAHLPTPLEPLPRLSAELGGPPLWVKRDDCTGLATGGNKTRKLEYLCGAAQEEGADWLVSFGALQSNHARQTAAAAARLGLGCDLILVDRVPHPEDAYTRSGNLLLDDLLGARVHRVADDAEAAAVLSHRKAELESEGHRIHVIATGGSSDVGALGYAECAAELLVQAAEQSLSIGTLVCATASAGTHAGLLAGFACAGEGPAVRGVNVYSPDGAKLRANVDALARDTAKRLDPEGDLRVPPCEVIEGQLGQGYGVPTEAMREAVRLVARTEGLLLDPVYAGKAMAGLIAGVRDGSFDADAPVVFLHTGGSAGLFAYAETLTAPRGGSAET